MAYQKLQAYRALKVLPNNSVDIPNPATLAISSTTTSNAPTKLIDTTQNFIEKGIKVGDIIYNTTSGVAMSVTAIDSADTLTVTGTAASSDSYEIYASENTKNLGMRSLCGNSRRLIGKYRRWRYHRIYRCISRFFYSCSSNESV